VALRVKVIPHASTNALVGWTSEAHEELSLKVTAAASQGKANTAVIELLARELDIPKSAISIKRGATSRHKLLELCIAPEQFNVWLAQKQFTNNQ